MPALSIVCQTCKSELIVAEPFVAQVAGQQRPCPICAAPLILSASAAVPPATPASLPVTPGKPVRLVCPHCSTQITLSYDSAQKIAGTALKCQKCEADIPVPRFDPAATPTPAAPAPDAAPARRKCSACLSPLEGEAAFCPICGTRLDNPKAGGLAGTTRLKVHAAEEPTPPVPCVKCKRMIDGDIVVCPHCKTNQTSGRRDKPDARPIGWKRDPITRSALGGLLHKIALIFFAGVLLILLSVAGFWFYKFIQSQIPQG